MMKVKNDEADCRVGCALLGTAMVGVVWVYRGRGKRASTLRERGHAAPQTLSSGRLSGPASAISEPIKSKYSLRAACRQGSLTQI